MLGARVEFVGECGGGDGVSNVDVAGSARLRRRDDGSGAAITRARTLASGMKLALTFHLALVQHGTLALRGTARIERLAGLCLGGHSVRRRRGKHAWPTGLARTG